MSASPSAATVTLPPKHVQWAPDRRRVPPGGRCPGREPRPRQPARELLLRDAKADVVYDEDWGEAILAIRPSLGPDFVVAEERAERDERGEFAEAYGDNVLVLEYTAKGLAKACTDWGGTLSIVRRVESVVPEGAGGYVHQTC
ncbi:hypothetical protein AB0N07_36885 [Streptomyces sp. NPDC051172]|uniref:hypothetical protein n=1 Tax=Streptomyces sp. NPDC051172 TaxID=3155796 RepID=UPI00343B8905